MAPITVAGSDGRNPLVSQDQISTQLADIQRTLGTLLADSKRVEEDRRQSSEHRARIHERLDELRDDMNDRFRHTDESIIIAGQVAAQARGEVQSLKAIVVDEIKPQTDDFKKMRMVGSGVMMAVAVAGTALGVTFSDVIQSLIASIRKLTLGH